MLGYPDKIAWLRLGPPLKGELSMTAPFVKPNWLVEKQGKVGIQYGRDPVTSDEVIRKSVRESAAAPLFKMKIGADGKSARLKSIRNSKYDVLSDDEDNPSDLKAWSRGRLSS